MRYETNLLLVLLQDFASEANSASPHVKFPVTLTLATQLRAPIWNLQCHMSMPCLRGERVDCALRKDNARCYSYRSIALTRGDYASSRYYPQVSGHPKATMSRDMQGNYFSPQAADRTFMDVCYATAMQRDHSMIRQLALEYSLTVQETETRVPTLGIKCYYQRSANPCTVRPLKVCACRDMTIAQVSTCMLASRLPSRNQSRTMHDQETAHLSLFLALQYEIACVSHLMICDRACSGSSQRCCHN